MSRIDTVETEVFKFDELTEEAQQTALKGLSDINVDHDWWESTYEDAGQIGLEIKGFDIDRGSYCEGEFINDPEDVAEAILKEHGEKCETYKTAKEFLSQKHIEDYEEAEDDFKQSLLEDYRIILSNEYDYLTGDEAIKETIEANDYEFTADGKMY